MINSFKLLNQKLENKIEKENISIVLSGVGAAGVATARLFLDYGFTNIFFIDSKGLISKERDEKDLNKEKIELLNKSTANLSEYKINEKLENVIKNKNVFIGLSKAGVLSQDMVKSMKKVEGFGPIIFALANPNPEIMPDEAKSAGAFIVATGRSDFSNQINNSLVFPGF
jgi:malate dehydrogenase (oxaloacetate-decarboxylating)